MDTSEFAIGGNGGVIFYDGQGHRTRVLRAVHTGPVVALASTQGGEFWSAGYDRLLVCYRLQTSLCDGTSTPLSVTQLGFTPTTLALAKRTSQDMTVTTGFAFLGDTAGVLHRITIQRCVPVLDDTVELDLGSPVTALLGIQQLGLVVAGLQDGSIALVDAHTMAIRTCKRPHNLAVLALTYSPALRVVISGAGDRSLATLNVFSESIHRLTISGAGAGVGQGAGGAVVFLHALTDSGLVISADCTGQVFVNDIRRGHTVNQLSTGLRDARAASFNTQTQTLALLSKQLIFLRSTASGDPRRAVHDAVVSLALYQSLVVVGTANGSVSLFSLANGHRVGQYNVFEAQTAATVDAGAPSRQTARVAKSADLSSLRVVDGESTGGILDNTARSGTLAVLECDSVSGALYALLHPQNAEPYVAVVDVVTGALLTTLAIQGDCRQMTVPPRSTISEGTRAVLVHGDGANVLCVVAPPHAQLLDTPFQAPLQHLTSYTARPPALRAATLAAVVSPATVLHLFDSHNSFSALAKATFSRNFTRLVPIERLGVLLVVAEAGHLGPPGSAMYLALDAGDASLLLCGLLPPECVGIGTAARELLLATDRGFIAFSPQGSCEVELAEHVQACRVFQQSGSVPEGYRATEAPTEAGGETIYSLEALGEFHVRSQIVQRYDMRALEVVPRARMIPRMGSQLSALFLTPADMLQAGVRPPVDASGEPVSVVLAGSQEGVVALLKSGTGEEVTRFVTAHNAVRGLTSAPPPPDPRGGEMHTAASSLERRVVAEMKGVLEEGAKRAAAAGDSVYENGPLAVPEPYFPLAADAMAIVEKVEERTSSVADHLRGGGLRKDEFTTEETALVSAVELALPVLRERQTSRYLSVVGSRSDLQLHHSDGHSSAQMRPAFMNQEVAYRLQTDPRFKDQPADVSTWSDEPIQRQRQQPLLDVSIPNDILMEQQSGALRQNVTDPAELLALRQAKKSRSAKIREVLLASQRLLQDEQSS